MPANPTIAAGTTEPFTATGNYSNGSTKNLTGSVSWQSQNTNAATITTGGMATAKAVGTSTIMATSGNVSGSTLLTVTSATLVSIAVTPANPSIAKGTTQQFTATGTFSDNSTQNLTGSVTWSSQSGGIATISAGGLATGVAAGTSVIQATSGGVSGSTTLTVTSATLVSIAVTPANPSIAKGTTKQFTATGTFSDNSTQNLTGSVTWSSQTTSIATITAGGLATGVGTGMSNIEATSGAVNGTTELTVTAATLVSIAVTPANPSIAKSATEQFTATGTFSDNSTQNLTGSVTWTSQTTSVATITAAGLATGVAAGTSTIKAASGAISGTTTLTVTPPSLVSIAVTPANPSIAKGTTQQFTATGTYSDNSTQNLTGSATWTSQTTAVATITAGGLATGAGTGTSTIKAALGAISGTTTLTVTAPTLVSIAVTPANPTISMTGTEQFTATGTFTDNSTQNLTSTATWTSQTTSVATINASGLATAVAAGTSTIKAASGSISGSTTLTVTSGSATLQVVVVSPQNPVIADNGATQTFTATGHFSDGSTQDLTSSATWTSSNSGSVASVSATGVATSRTLTSVVGYTAIQAAVGAIKGVSILSVTNHTSNSSGFAGVVTQHNDIGRTGQNLAESILTPANVNTTTFGKLFSQAVDGEVYAQPLYVPHVTIGGSVHNVLYVATEGDSVYAFDADSNAGGNAAALWHASMIDTAHGAAAGATTMNVASALPGCDDLTPQVGITSTPVIDPSTGTMYVEAKSKENGAYIHRLHALDITTGAEKAPGPTVITATVPGTGDGSSGGELTMDALHQMNRPGLLWVNGTLYLAYASHCDYMPWHGWLFAYDAGTFDQTSVFVTTPNASDGGFWMSGAGVAGDSNANVFISSGNGSFDTTNIPATELGDTTMKLFYSGTSTLSLLDYFTPQNESMLGGDGGDEDLGSGGVVLLPDQAGSNAHELVQGGKQGLIYVINRDQMTANNLHFCQTNCNGMDPQIVQEVQLETSGDQEAGLFSMPAYFNGTLYYAGVNDSLKAFPLSNGMLPASPSHTTAQTFGFPGATPSVSANGNANGIVWVLERPNSGPVVLMAYQAGTLTPLWNSSQTGSDTAGDAIKFSVPTIANGKVYVGTQTEIDVYGTKP
ncbi:MAG: Ig-like domain-containing protein [Candidatus Acidiferrales bacterium]